MRFVYFIILLFIFFISTPIINHSLQAQDVSHSQIMFLHFYMKGDTIQLIDSSIRPGKVKNRRVDANNEKFMYEVFSSTGQSLWKGSLEDPLIERVEYEDPENPGKIKMDYVKLEDAHFVIKIPHLPISKRISFYKYLQVKPDKGNRSVSKAKIIDIELQ